MIHHTFSITTKNFSSWVCKHPQIIALYPDNNSIHEQLESEVKSFVQLRNDASHGSLDNLEGEDNLRRLCDLNKALVYAISSFVRKSLIAKKEYGKHLTKLGVVTEVFNRNKVFVAQIRSGVSFKVGDNLLILEQCDCYSAKIESLMVNNNSVNEILSQIESCEVGIKLRKQVKNNSKIYFLN